MADSAAEMLPKLSSFKASLNTASQGAQQLARGTQQLSEKSSSLLELKKGISTLDSSMTTAVGGSSELYKGSQALVSGLQRVDQGAGALQSGSATIGNGAQQLYDASTLLKDKTGELHAGMSKFKTTGIDEMQKQVSLSLDDVTQLLAIKDEIVKEAEQEHTFSGAPKNSESKVKYIYKTEELQKEKKTDKGKNFAGAEATYTIEALMHDCKALQSGTSHNFGNGFAKAFGIEYTNKENKLSPVYETSWGMSTRIIGAIIMVHGDDSGLVLPPRIAPVQTMIIPIQQKKEGVLDKAFEIRDMLKSNFSVKVDDSDKSPGWKFSEQEIQGIPTRIEIGPKDIEKGQAVIVRRDTREKIVTPIEKIEETLAEVLETMQNDMYNKAKAHLERNTHIAHNWEEFNDILENQQGFIRAMWCGEENAKKPSKTRMVQQHVVFHLYRQNILMYAYIAENQQNVKYTLEKHTKYEFVDFV